MKHLRIFQLILALLIGLVLLAWPATTFAQTTPPPIWVGEGEGAIDDILVFEPMLFFELPFMQGFKVSFTFGISIQVPRQLVLVNDDVFNFFLRFSNYVIPASGAITP